MIFTSNGVLKYNIRTGGEIDVKYDSLAYQIMKVTAIIENANDIMALLLLNNIASIQCLYIQYLPYARQDRKCEIGEPLSIKIMAQLINSMNIPTVLLFNPHSDVAGALINNCKIITQEQCMRQLLESFSEKDYVLVAPDQGAMKKIEKIKGRELAFATKIRDETGNPRIVDVVGDVKDKNCLVTDDICDGGRTFIELAIKLKEKGANKLMLYTTYGIYCNGIDELLKYYDSIQYNWLVNCTIKHDRLQKVEW